MVQTGIDSGCMLDTAPCTNHPWTWLAEAVLVPAAAVEDTVAAAVDIVIVGLGDEVGVDTSAAKAVDCTALTVASTDVVEDMALAEVDVGKAETVVEEWGLQVAPAAFEHKV